MTITQSYIKWEAKKSVLLVFKKSVFPPACVVFLLSHTAHPSSLLTPPELNLSIWRNFSDWSET